MRQYQAASVAFSAFVLSILNNHSVLAKNFTWQVYNQTSEILTEFYVVPSTFGELGEPEYFGPNQLRQSVAPNNLFNVSLDTDSPSCFYDFVGIFGDRLQIIDYMVNLCAIDSDTYAFGNSYGLDNNPLILAEPEDQYLDPIPFPNIEERSNQTEELELRIYSDDPDASWRPAPLPEAVDNDVWTFADSDERNQEPQIFSTSNESSEISTWTFNNQTRHALTKVYITPSSYDTFGYNQLSPSLAPGTSRNISIDRQGCFYDVLGIFEDGSEVVDYDINICTLSGNVTYTLLDPTNETQDIQVYNGTPNNIVGLRIKAEYSQNTEDNWGASSASSYYEKHIVRSGELFAPGEEYLLTTNLEFENCANFETYEITATFSGPAGRYDEKQDIDACSSETIIFGEPKSGVERRFTVQNGFNNVVLWGLYATKSTDDDWGYDLLKQPVVPSERSHEIALIDDSDDCLYDIQAVFIDPTSSRKLDPIEQYDVNVCSLSRVC